jgi:hypothetical protein
MCVSPSLAQDAQQILARTIELNIFSRSFLFESVRLLYADATQY